MQLRTLTLAGIALLSLNTPAIAGPSSLSGQQGTLNFPLHGNRNDYAAYAKQVSANIQSHAADLPTGKTTALSSRIVGYAYREYDGSSLFLLDTARLNYSYGRGGDLTSDFIKFDNAKSWSYNDTFSKLQESYLQTQTFDALNNISTRLEQEWDRPSATFINSSRTFLRFNTDKKQTVDSVQMWTGAMWENSTLSRMKYDASKNLIADSNYEWDGSDWIPAYVEEYTYTAAGKVSTYTAKVYESTSGMWILVMKTNYTYDGSGNLTQDLMQVIGSSLVLENYSRSTYTYDAAKNQIGQVTEMWDDVSSAWMNYFKQTNRFDASANKVESIEMNWNDGTGLYDTSMHTLYTYNTSKQMTSEATETWNSTAHSWKLEMGDAKTNYYYADFDATNVKLEDKFASVKVFPVPASDVLNLNISPSQQQDFTIGLVDMQGRVLYARDIQSAATFNGQIPVANIPSGSYILTISGDKGLKVTQHVTVAH